MQRHGKPVAFYSDKASVFRVNARTSLAGHAQFGRAMGELNMEATRANTPQAKGRLERFKMRFARPAVNPRDAHQLLLDGHVLPEVFS